MQIKNAKVRPADGIPPERETRASSQSRPDLGEQNTCPDSRCAWTLLHPEWSSGPESGLVFNLENDHPFLLNGLSI